MAQPVFTPPIDFRPLEDGSMPLSKTLSTTGAPRDGWLAAGTVCVLFGATFLVGFAHAVPAVAGRYGSATAAPWIAGLVLSALVTLWPIIALTWWLRANVHLVPDLRPRMDAFAAANDLSWSDGADNPAYPGAIFAAHDPESFTASTLSSNSGRRFEIGNYSTPMEGNRRTDASWGYIALRLDRPVPHMMLESRTSRVELPHDIAGAQKLDLEGDFNRSFQLLVPAGYERDALYIFTPDVMALLVDDAGGYDVELVDEWMFVYTPTALTGPTVDAYRRLFRIIDELGGRVIDVSGRYLDTRASPEPSSAPIGVAPSLPEGGRHEMVAIGPGGRRLRGGGSRYGRMMLWVLIDFAVALGLGWWALSSYLSLMGSFAA